MRASNQVAAINASSESGQGQEDMPATLAAVGAFRSALGQPAFERLLAFA